MSSLHCVISVIALSVLTEESQLKISLCDLLNADKQGRLGCGRCSNHNCHQVVGGLLDLHGAPKRLTQLRLTQEVLCIRISTMTVHVFSFSDQAVMLLCLVVLWMSHVSREWTLRCAGMCSLCWWPVRWGYRAWESRKGGYHCVFVGLCWCIWAFVKDESSWGAGERAGPRYYGLLSTGIIQWDGHCSYFYHSLGEVVQSILCSAVSEVVWV